MKREKERERAKAKGDPRVRKNDITHDPYTRENEDVKGTEELKKEASHRSKQRCTFTHWSFTKIKPVEWTAGPEQQPAQHVEFVTSGG